MGREGLQTSHGHFDWSRQRLASSVGESADKEWNVLGEGKTVVVHDGVDKLEGRGVEAVIKDVSSHNSGDTRVVCVKHKVFNVILAGKVLVVGSHVPSWLVHRIVQAVAIFKELLEFVIIKFTSCWAHLAEETCTSCIVTKGIRIRVSVWKDRSIGNDLLLNFPPMVVLARFRQQVERWHSERVNSLWHWGGIDNAVNQQIEEVQGNDQHNRGQDLADVGLDFTFLKDPTLHKKGSELVTASNVNVSLFVGFEVLVAVLLLLLLLLLFLLF
mmetsp:Transcript_23009/g.32093  ORF Transcript_23009/g.32093 Transcript_23009/m.32093 type:complete len:271 (+) Transcript_23009:1426-2238(+)